MQKFLSIWFDKPGRRLFLLLGVCALISLTILASLPINIIGPFDARTGKPADCAKVKYSPAGAVIEPVMALAHIIADSPNVRQASFSIPVWIVGLTVFITAAVKLRKNRWRADKRTITSIIGTTGRVVLIVAIYGMFDLLTRIPNWQAVSTNPDIILAELHTHTFGSFDALISAKDSLRWHSQRGCRVVAVINHDSLEDSLKAAELAEKDKSLPAVIPGVELNLEGLNACVMMGPKEQLANPKFEASNLQLQRHQASCISWFHQNCQGAVLTLRYGLRIDRVKKIIEAGVDGFDIINDGHPYVGPELQAEVLAEASANHLPLVAFSDWHGYGGILRTWTAIRIPGVSKLSRKELTTAVLDILRRHDYLKITPLVVGDMRKVSSARIVFAPFVESIRYALELSPLRLAAWWVWSIAMFLITTYLMHLRISPARMIWALATAGLGVLVIIGGKHLVIAYFSGEAPFPYPLYFGLEALLLGVTAVSAGIINGFNAVRHAKK